MGFVGTADLAHLRAAGVHDFRDPEGTADLHQFAAGDGHGFPLCQRVEHQEDGTRVVVDHHGGLGAGEFAEKLFDKGIAAATAAGLGVIFQVAVAFGEFGNMHGGIFAQRGAAQIGVEHHTGGIDDALHTEKVATLQPAEYGGFQLVGRWDAINTARQGLFAQFVQAVLDGGFDEGIGITLLRVPNGGTGQERICFRNLP